MARRALLLSIVAVTVEHDALHVHCPPLCLCLYPSSACPRSRPYTAYVAAQGEGGGVHPTGVSIVG